MHAKKHLQWLEKKRLLEKVKKNSGIFKKVLRDCLDVQEDERILIITDQGYENRRISALISGSYYLAARKLGFDATIIVQEPKIKGDKASEDTVLALKELGMNNIVIMSLSGKLGSIKEISKSYRNFVRESHNRFVSATNLGRISNDHYQTAIDTINIDYKEMQKKGNEIKKRLDKGKEARIVTDAGTDLRIDISKYDAKLNTGEYKMPGTGGNIPAGEVYIPPTFKRVEGRIVIDGSSAYREGTQLIEEPIDLKVKKGEIVEIKGGEEAYNLRETLDWAAKKAKYPWGIRRIGELGIGINPNARIIGATIIDEKVKGTAHIGIGSNYWFGGTIYAIIHLDQVFRNPKIYIDGEQLKV